MLLSTAQQGEAVGSLGDAGSQDFAPELLDKGVFIHSHVLLALGVFSSI